ncbi:MAG: Holliday junction resolvase RuvX [Actinomycetota bacterium]|nr:MAG: Holliday junction resolvase RuvX [Actinomycetota bacterium]
MRPGVRLGVDVGSVRVGVARSDPAGTLAVPETTLQRGSGDLAALAALVTDCDALEVLVGLPIGLDGREGAAAGLARQYAEELAVLVSPVPVRLVDERFTTTQAHRDLRAAGRNSRRRRTLVDQTAAAIIVQHALDAERATGAPPGTILQR